MHNSTTKFLQARRDDTFIHKNSFKFQAHKGKIHYVFSSTKKHGNLKEKVQEDLDKIMERRQTANLSQTIMQNTCPSTRNIMTDASSTAALACLSIIEGILATAASLEASGIPSIPIVVVIAKSSITSTCDFAILRTPPVSTTINSYSPQKDLPYKRSLVTPGSSTTIARFPYINQRKSAFTMWKHTWKFQFLFPQYGKASILITE